MKAVILKRIINDLPDDMDVVILEEPNGRSRVAKGVNLAWFRPDGDEDGYQSPTETEGRYVSNEEYQRSRDLEWENDWTPKKYKFAIFIV